MARQSCLILQLFLLTSYLQSYFTADEVNDNVLPVPTSDAKTDREDEALLKVSFNLKFSPVSISFRSRRCYKCQFTSLNESEAYYVNTRFPYDFKIHCNIPTHNNTCYIDDYLFDDGNIYTLDIQIDADCNLVCHGPKSYSSRNNRPLLGAFYGLVYAAVLLMVFIVTRALYASGTIYFLLPRRGLDNNIVADLGNPETEDDRVSAVPSINSSLEPSFRQSQMGASEEKETKKRIKSLDAFRGITIVLMIFVNSGGGGYWFFNHSSWNGLTFADIVFPWFVFIMGISITASMRNVSYNEINMTSTKSLLQVLSRSTNLFVLGLVISNGNVSAEYIRIMGVLQRLGISYCFVAVMEIYHSKYMRRANLNLLSTRMGPPVWFHTFLDIYPFWFEWLIMAVLVAAWLLITFLVHDPACPRGYLGPGGWQNATDYNVHDCTGGAAGFIDRSIFGQKHVYQNPTAKTVYGPDVLPYDPEGLLGCLTSIFLAFLGVQAGRIMLIYKKWKPIILRWMIWALVTGAIAGGLCQFSLNEGVLPVNKNIWSLSFVLATGSLGFIFMAILYVIIDEFQLWDGVPFVYAGMNSILLYLGHELLMGFFPFCWGVKYPTHTIFMLENVTTCLMWIVIAGMNSILLYLGHELLMGFFPFCWGVKYPTHTIFMLENVTTCLMWIVIAGMNSILLYLGHELLMGFFPFCWGVKYPTHTIFMLENVTTCLMWIVIAGMNSILLYLGHELLMGFFPFCWGVKYPTHTIFMLENVTTCLMWIVIAGLFYRKRLFLKV